MTDLRSGAPVRATIIDPRAAYVGSAPTRLPYDRYAFVHGRNLAVPYAGHAPVGAVIDVRVTGNGLRVVAYDV